MGQVHASRPLNHGDFFCFAAIDTLALEPGEEYFDERDRIDAKGSTNRRETAV